MYQKLKAILAEWCFPVWGLHVDNGSEFINNQIFRFCQENGLAFTRNRPYRKNVNAHVEQKNRQYVREIVGYERYDTPQAVAWLNEFYACLDPYTNLFLLMRKVVAKERHGLRIRKSYDAARAPVQRLLDTNVINLPTRASLDHQLKRLNPLTLHRQLEKLLATGPQEVIPQPQPTTSLG